MRMHTATQRPAVLKSDIRTSLLALINLVSDLNLSRWSQYKYKLSSTPAVLQEELTDGVMLGGL